MAWNEPGNSGGRDPWGGRGDNQGPPDLNDVVRKLQNKFSGLFGGRGSGMSSIVLILVVILGVWALSGIYIVDEGKRGVVLQFGAYKETTLPGPHWFPRLIQSVYIVDMNAVRSMEVGNSADEALMLTQDENIIDVKFTVQYQIKDARDYLFNVKEPEQTLREVAESAVREIVGQSEMDFVLTAGRSEIRERAKKLVQQILDRYGTGLVVVNLNMQNIQAPDQVQGAFADVVKAREDEQRLKNEAETYANGILPQARGDAARKIEEANAYKSKVIAEAQGETSRFLSVLGQYKKWPAVTRKRMYLDAMESVLQRSGKIVVDTKSSNNLLYLPLDKIAQPLSQRTGTGSAATSSSSATSGSTSTSSSTDTVPSSASNRDDRSRNDLRQREVR